MYHLINESAKPSPTSKPFILHIHCTWAEASRTVRYRALTLSKKRLASSTMFLKASSSYQHSLVVRHSSCSTEVTTKDDSCVPRLQPSRMQCCQHARLMCGRSKLSED